jgi:hypothetical protein
MTPRAGHLPNVVERVALQELKAGELPAHNVLDGIAKAGAGFRSLADTWADTATPHGRLLFTVLAGL